MNERVEREPGDQNVGERASETVMPEFTTKQSARCRSSRIRCRSIHRLMEHPSTSAGSAKQRNSARSRCGAPIVASSQSYARDAAPAVCGGWRHCEG